MEELEDDEYYIMHRGNLQNLINKTYKDHFKGNNDCEGDFHLIRVDKRMLSTSWVLQCGLCEFKSDIKKMYREHDTGKAGRNQSTLNSSVGMALSFSSIGARQFSQLMLDIGIDAGTTNCINDHISAACDKLKTLAEESMTEERTNLKTVPNADLSCDGRYNLRSRNAPCQPATQAVFTVIENNSGKGKVVDCVTKNKVCRKGIVMRQKGFEVSCPSDTHNCTATMEPLDCIANEGEYAKESLSRIKDGGVHIGSVTADGDVKIKKAVRECLGEDVETFNDPRHLANAMKKSIQSHNFSADMFNRGKKGTVRQKKGWFADDMRVRLEIEFNHAEKTAEGLAYEYFENQPGTSKSNISTCSEFRERKKNEMYRLLEGVPEILVECLKKGGNCKMCTLCCKNDGVFFKKKYKGKLNMSESDQSDLKKLIEKRIGKEAIKCTYMKKHTQKNEAFNRVLLKTLPKTTSSPKNFEGRVSAAILLNNKGTDGAHAVARSAVHHSVSEKVRFKELAFEKEREKKRISQKTCTYKQNRVSNMIHLFDAYNERDHDFLYEKGIDLPK